MPLNKLLRLLWLLSQASFWTDLHRELRLGSVHIPGRSELRLLVLHQEPGWDPMCFLLRHLERSGKPMCLLVLWRDLPQRGRHPVSSHVPGFWVRVSGRQPLQGLRLPGLRGVPLGPDQRLSLRLCVLRSHLQVWGPVLLKLPKLGSCMSR